MPVHFEDSNLTLKKPRNMTDEQCSDLTAYRGVDNSGFPYILTGWMPNREDIEAINEGRPIYIKTIGEAFAPLSIFTLDQEGNCNE